MHHSYVIYLGINCERMMLHLTTVIVFQESS